MKIMWTGQNWNRENRENRENKKWLYEDRPFKEGDSVCCSLRIEEAERKKLISSCS